MLNNTICKFCKNENPSDSFYCKLCGRFLQDEMFETDGVADEAQMKMVRIISNLKENPHYPIVWNETVNAFMKKVERIESLIKVKDAGIESDELSRKVTDFLDLCRKPDFQIAFVGTIKTGKSTLINSLLGRNYASMDVTPETAALTKFRSSEKSYIKVTFYTKKEWDKLWKSVQNGADKFIEEYKELKADREKDKWVGHTEQYIEVSNQDIESELSKWSSSKSATHYFVREIEVGISTLPKEFPKQVIFVDTPGLSDPVEYRSQISRDYIRKANAVFVCVDAAKMYKEEIETISSVFSFSGHKKSKVHIVATHWDTLNDPVDDWKKQKNHWTKLLTGKSFYDTVEMAKKNIMYSSAYIFNLCRDYQSLERRERKALMILPYKLDLDMGPGDLTQAELKELMEITNIYEINNVIVDELAKKYSELLYGDIENLYKDIKYTVKRIASSRKKELEERISLSQGDIQELEKKVLEKKNDYEEIQSAQKQLKAALESLDKSTKRRLKEITLQLEQG